MQGDGSRDTARDRAWQRVWVALCVLAMGAVGIAAFRVPAADARRAAERRTAVLRGGIREPAPMPQTASLMERRDVR